MRQHMVQRQAAFAGEMQQRLQGTLADLERLQAEQVQQLELRLEKQLEQVRRSRFERRSQGIRRVFDEYRQWVEETLSTEPEPYLQVLAAVWADPYIYKEPCYGIRRGTASAIPQASQLRRLWSRAPPHGRMTKKILPQEYPMTLNIKNPETHRLATELARLTGRR